MAEYHMPTAEALQQVERTLELIGSMQRAEWEKRIQETMRKRHGLFPRRFYTQQTAEKRLMRDGCLGVDPCMYQPSTYHRIFHVAQCDRVKRLQALKDSAIRAQQLGVDSVVLNAEDVAVLEIEHQVTPSTLREVAVSF
jgi:hypothetical protein